VEQPSTALYQQSSFLVFTVRICGFSFDFFFFTSAPAVHRRGFPRWFDDSSDSPVTGLIAYEPGSALLHQSASAG